LNKIEAHPSDPRISTIKYARAGWAWRSKRGASKQLSDAVHAKDGRVLRLGGQTSDFVLNRSRIQDGKIGSGFAGDPFGEGRAGCNRCRTASHLVSRFGSPVSLEPHGEPQNVAASRV
jgi:hypothetical protein